MTTPTVPDQPTSQEPPDEAPKNAGLQPRNIAIALGVVIALIGAIVWGVVASSTGPKPLSAEALANIEEASQVTVRFELTTSDPDPSGRTVSITIRTPGGGTSQQTGVTLPLTHQDGTPFEFTAHAGDFLYLSAQNEQDYGDLSCSITIDGQVIDSASSSGAYVIASCSGEA